MRPSGDEIEPRNARALQLAAAVAAFDPNSQGIRMWSVSKRGVRDPSPTSLLHAHEEVAADQLNARPESAARADRTDGFPLGDYGRRATEAPGHRDGSSRS